LKRDSKINSKFKTDIDNNYNCDIKKDHYNKDDNDERIIERNKDKKMSFKLIAQNLCYDDNIKNISSIFVILIIIETSGLPNLANLKKNSAPITDQSEIYNLSDSGSKYIF